MSVSFATTAAWGIVVLVAFVGWGGALGSRLFGPRRIDTGLRAAWGMALAILAGGTASLFSLASRGMIFAFVALGCVLALVELFRSPPRFDLPVLAAYWKQYPGTALLLCVCAAAALLQYVGAICNLRFNANDDFIAYFPFAEQILQTGTLFDPFSTRRVMSFGGHSFLHAVVLAGSAGFRLHMLDQGVCLLITALLIFGSRTKGRSSLSVLLALLVLLTLPEIRINTYAEMSGVALFYGLYRTLVWLDEREGDERTVASAIVVALVASAVCTLRSNYMAVCVPMVAFSYAHLFRKSGAARGQRLREAAIAALLSFAFLVPWMLLSYRSSGTPLFPILRGHFNDAFPLLQKPGNWHQQLSDLVRTVTQHHLIRTFPLLFLAGLLLPDRGRRKPLHALLLSGVIGWILLVHTLASDVPSFERYVYGFLVAGVIAVTTRIETRPDAKESAGARDRYARIGSTLAAVGVLVQLFLVTPFAIESHEQMRLRIAVLARLPIHAARDMAVAPVYRALQARVPPRQRLLVMVDYPFLFDFARNDIFNIDTAAAVSPPPGFPYFRGAEAVAAYLRGQSIRYFAFVRPQKSLSLYRTDFWESQRADPDAFWHAQAPVYLDLFTNLETLALSRKRLYDNGEVLLLDLNERAMPATARETLPRIESSVPDVMEDARRLRSAGGQTRSHREREPGSLLPGPGASRSR